MWPKSPKIFNAAMAGKSAEMFPPAMHTDSLHPVNTSLIVNRSRNVYRRALNNVSIYGAQPLGEVFNRRLRSGCVRVCCLCRCEVRLCLCLFNMGKQSSCKRLFNAGVHIIPISLLDEPNEYSNNNARSYNESPRRTGASQILDPAITITINGNFFFN